VHRRFPSILMKAATAARLVATGLLALALAGCVLQSEQPAFDDGDGALLLKDYGSQFATYTYTGAEWKKDTDTITFTQVQNHYIASDGNSGAAVTFVSLGTNWWVMQAAETGKPPVYVLAQAELGELLFYPISCQVLRESGSFDDVVSFENDDCFIRDGADVGSLFTAIMAIHGKPSTKLVPVG
jgi:hypothetical protein